MAEYLTTVGLEIHAELKTKTKMFCNSRNAPHESNPNVHVCPICMAFPGTLPVINKEAVRHVLRVGAAVDGTLADYTEFDRKNYFYPDLPKGYQISQYKYPLVSGGTLSDVSITRIHLEEDTARSQHLPAGADTDGSWSLVDFNRAGVPLMELVTEPVIHDAKKASEFAQELQLLLRTLGASDANMEKGEMRVEANISVSRDNNLGTKVEVKNLNSFRSVERAIAFETNRHIELLEKGEKIIQETRGWDENKQQTFSQRIKEDSHDYRYFPDPDLPKIRLSNIPEFTKEHIVNSLPELPQEKRKRLAEIGLEEKFVEILMSDTLYFTIYEKSLSSIADVKTKKIATDMLLSTVRGLNPTEEELNNLGESLRVGAEMRVAGSVSSTAAASALQEVLKTGKPFDSVVEEKGLLQIHDTDTLKEYANEAIVKNPSVVEDLKGGKESALQYLVGQGMKASRGAANPQELSSAIKEILGL